MSVSTLQSFLESCISFISLGRSILLSTSYYSYLFFLN